MKKGKEYMDGLEKPKSNYDFIPVFYCKTCLSLKIMTIDDFGDYCDECGGTDIEQTDIETWEKMYQEKYGVKFLDKDKTKRTYK